jgi:hypothetical protein
LKDVHYPSVPFLGEASVTQNLRVFATRPDGQ